MKNIYLLSENQVDLIAQKTKQQMEMSNFKKVFGTLFNELNSQKGLHIKNMKKMNESKRQEYLEEMMDNYVLDIFPRTNFIHEQFDNNFTNNMLLESSNHSFRSLYNFFDFLKSSVLYECGFLNRRNFNISLNEQGFWDGVGNLVDSGVNAVKTVANKGVALAKAGVQTVKTGLQKGYQTVKTGINKGIEIGKKVVQTVTPYITKFLDSEFAYLVPGLNTIKLGMDAKKVYDNWEKIKKMTFEDWVETFRNFLNGVAGIAIQIVLALTGVGNLVNLIAWGLLTVYDIGYQGFAKGNWNWYNVLTDCVGLLGSGAAAAIFKGVKTTLTTIKSIQAFIPGIASASKTTPAITKTVVPWLQKIVTGGGTIITKIGQAFTWITTKIPLIGKVMKPLQKFTKSVENFFLEIGKGMKKYFSTGALTQNMKVAKGSHFDLVSLGKKVAAVGDKNITKQIVGKVTKLYYTIAKGDTLQKILQKFAGAGLTMEILNQLNYANGLKINPGNKVRVA
jgi:LysM repeat protein